jgi:glycosyltransferase involved in cell wall biosynthesis
MKIGIDVSQVVYGTGVSRYTKNLVEELLLLDNADKFVLFGGALRRQSEMREYLRSLKSSNTRKVFVPMSPRMADFIWNRVHRLHIEKLIGKVDVFHSSDWTQPPTRAFNVTTIHDLAPIKYPKLTPARIVETHKQRLEWVRKEVDRIIVPSQSIMNDLIAMKFEKHKIRVIHEAADKIYKPQGKQLIDLIKKKYSITTNYLFVVGTNLRKNNERILKAFKQLKKDVPLELVIIGNRPHDWKDVEGVKVLGHVPDDELPTLYSGASALVYPSLYEGFGLPILESFACKTPVVTSNVGSMAEIGKGAAVLVDPESVEAIVKGIKKVLLNRNDYILKGMKRVKEYSWKKAARETLEVYRESIQN